MRGLIGGLLLLGILWLASTIETPAAHEPSMSSYDSATQDWRRTAAGWERRSSIEPRVAYRPATPHPGIVGLLEVLLVVGIVVAYSPERKIADRAAGEES